jgi:hypothetical protein
VISLLDRDSRRPGAEQDMALLALFADQAALARARTFAHRLASGIYGA